MRYGMLTRRDILQFALGGLIVFLMIAALVTAWLLQYTPLTKPIAVLFTPPITAADVDQLLSQQNKPDRRVGHIPSIWIVALSRLESLGPAAAPFGAIEKLEAFIATAPEGEAKEAAKRARDKVKGP
jgi:hypothetical protein